jgi:hypothetical protein
LTITEGLTRYATEHEIVVVSRVGGVIDTSTHFEVIFSILATQVVFPCSYENNAITIKNSSYLTRSRGEVVVAKYFHDNLGD